MTASQPQEEPLEATPLWSGWELWCDFPQRPNRGQRLLERGAAHQFNWLDTIKSVGIFDTAEGFWGLHDCVLPPSKLPNGANLYLFRKNIPPMWEHEANRRGGKWLVSFEPERSPDADEAWTTLCLNAIGENVPCNEVELCGVVVSKRKAGYRLAVWTRNAHDATAQTKIGLFLKTQLNLGEAPIVYTEHGQSLQAPRPAPATPTPKGHRGQSGGSSASATQAAASDEGQSTAGRSSATADDASPATPTKEESAAASPEAVEPHTPGTQQKAVSPAGGMPSPTLATPNLPLYTL